MGSNYGLIMNEACLAVDALFTGQKEEVSSSHGLVTITRSDKWVMIYRNGNNDCPMFRKEKDTLSYLEAFASLGIKKIIGVHSCGSLRPSLTTGSLIIPDDWVCLYPQITTVCGERRLYTPSFSKNLRQKLIDAAWKAGVKFENGGIFWQNPGPRLETKAEIKLMNNFADVVGMSLATEATLAQEMSLEYAAMCSVTNYANGLSTPCLTSELIFEQSRNNAGPIKSVLDSFDLSKDV